MALPKNGDDAGAARAETRGGRTPLVITFVVVLILGAAYYAYYRKQSSYFTGRNLRLLAKLTGQIDEQFAANLTIDNALRPILARQVRDTFDIVLVTSANGRVLRPLQPPPSSSSLLYHDDDTDDDLARRTQTRPPLTINSLGDLAVVKGWRGEPSPLPVAKLATSTFHAEVTFDGNDFVLFSQPLTFSESQFEGRPWILCGLVAKSRFRSDAMAVSASLVLLGIAIVLLAICCWPFLRIALIDPSQALAIGDVVLVVLCTVVGAAVMTLTMYDAFEYSAISTAADGELERFAETVNRNFALDVGRAMRVLARLETLTAGRPVGPDGISPLPPEVATDGEVARYPYIDSIFWIDSQGMEAKKFTRALPASLLSVQDRRYFIDARDNATWSAGNQPYVLEWVHSRSTGETHAVVAKHTGDPKLPVVALSTELIDITHSIQPPGVELAIVDEDGTVVYHSDEQRIGFENFFAEADRNRELRAAVLARRADFVTASYGGEDTSMYVRPLKYSPWTLVAFRHKRLTRVLNVEGVLLTILMLILVSTPYLLVYILTLVFKPSYRAARLWPDATRGGEYLRLNIILIALLFVSWVNNYVLTPWSSFVAATVLPVIAIFSTELVLHRAGPRVRFAAVGAFLAIPYAICLAWFIGSGSNVESGFVFSPYGKVMKGVLVVLLCGMAALTTLLLSHWSGGERLRHRLHDLHTRIGYARLYRLCGVLLLVVAVAMPVIAFFTISRDVESELLRKYGQLRAASDLEHRITHIETASVAAKNSPEVLQDIAGTRLDDGFLKWAIEPLPNGGPPMPVDGTACVSNSEDWTIAPDAARLLPVFYEDSVAIRPLFEARAADDLWFWCLQKQYVKLQRNIRLDDAVATKLWGSPKPDQRLIMSSVVPQGPADWRHYLLLLIGAAVLLALFRYATRFIASRVLLIDVDAPRWMAQLPLSPSLGDHIFLVRGDRDADALTGPNPMGDRKFLDVSFAELDRSSGWDAMLETIDSSTAGANVRVTDFEFGINDSAANDQKLRWLERLMLLSDRTVILVSAVSPAFIMTTPPPALAMRGAVLWYFDRWRALLSRFVTVTAADLQLSHEQLTRQQEMRSTTRLAMKPPSWLEHETEYNCFLRGLRKELDPSADRHLLLDEISERARTYYAGLWESCNDDDKLLLYHLARHGLANGRNRRTLRRVIARGLVRRDPNVQLFSETFRLYILEAASRENLAARARAERPASTWDALRGPFFVVIISFLLLLFVTQKDLMSTTTALATALTTGLPVLMKLVGTFTERRSDSGK